MTIALPPLIAEQIDHDERTLASDRIAADLLCEQITVAQTALAASDELLNGLSVGAEDGELSPVDRGDAAAELNTARRALRNLARIAAEHAETLDDLARS
ncbi:hypothetical protein ACWEU6_36180 [Streptosporangium sandarakinum]